MILNLILKGKWYDMIESGEKTEEYREIKPYWIRRLCSSGKGHDVDGDANDYSDCKDCMKCFNGSGENWCVYPFDQVCFHRGYTSKCMTFEVKSASYGIGKPEWGAPENKSVFIIELGRRIENEKD